MDQLMETVSRLGVLNALTKTFKYHTMPEYIREIENMA
jgi:N-acyl-D-aspartate/D-glutamate deacylase